MTALGKALEQQFKGGAEAIKTMPLANLRGGIQAAREGEDCANIAGILPSNAQHFNRLVSDRRTNGFDLKKPEDRKEYQRRLIATRESREASEDMASYRKFTLTNDVWGSPFALSAFQTVNLGDDELPLLEFPMTGHYNSFTVRSQSINGGPREAQWRSTKDVTQYEMDSLATDRVSYPIVDIQQGDINQSEAINQKLRLAMDLKVDATALVNVDAAAATSGLRANLSLDPLIVAANIPDENSFDLNAMFTGNDDVLTITKFKYILSRIALLQSVGGPLAGLTVSSFHCSPQNLQDSWNFVDLVSGFNLSGATQDPATTVTPQTRQQIFSTGQFTSAWGYNFSWVPSNQIAKGKLYVFMNQPLGWCFTKTQHDRVFVWDENNSPDHAESNMGEVMYRRVLTFVVPALWKYRVLIITL